MGFSRIELAFERGLFANRSRHASKRRWVDGDFVRFRDGVPGSMGGYLTYPTTGVAITGNARAFIAWRPNDQSARYAAIGTDEGAYKFDGDEIFDITPAGFSAGSGTTGAGYGYGSDRYGVDFYGTERQTAGNLVEASVWTFDMFGETLLGCFNADGIIYAMETTDTALVAVTGAPTARAICMSDERSLFAFGADGYPGLVKWSDREDYTTWDPGPTNRAGGYELQVRSPFQCGARVRGRMLGWTRTEVFAFTPIYNALVYAYDRISTEAGTVGPHAVAVVTDNEGESAYWIGHNNFYMYDGLVRTLPCELWDYVFGDMNLLQQVKFHAAVNSAFDEVWFFYCSSASEEPDRAVIYNYADGSWSKASVGRLCWIDSGVFTNPLAIDASGAIFSHEIGQTADGSILGSYVVSHPIQVGIGEVLADVDQFWPDLQTGSADVNVSFLIRNTIGGDATEIGPSTVTISDEFLPLAFSARELQLKVAENTETGGAWELGVPQLSLAGGSLR